MELADEAMAKTKSRLPIRPSGFTYKPFDTKTLTVAWLSDVFVPSGGATGPSFSAPTRTEFKLNVFHGSSRVLVRDFLQ